MIEQRELFNNGEIRFITLNTEHGEKPLVVYPEASAIIAFLPNSQADKSIVLVEQMRYGAGRKSLEIPAGKSLSGELPVDCARRELQEETGYTCDNFQKVMRYYPAIGICTEVLYIFLANGQLKPGLKKPDVDETDLQTVLMTKAQMQSAIENDLIIDGKTILAYHLWLNGSV